MMALAGAAAAWCAAPLAVVHAAQPAGGGAAWGKAIEVPGLAALNAGGTALVVSVSCASAGSCTAGGYYQGGHFHGQAFVVSQRRGRWGSAIRVPGTVTLNTGGSAGVNAVSCASAGNCVAGGFYTHRVGKKDFGQAFVASQRNGRWGTAIEVPGTATLNTAGNAQVTSVSCASAGNCTAGGFYSDSSGQQAFVASQRNGRWRPAIEVPGTATLNAGGLAQVTSVSCAPAGNCAAGGFYRDGSGHSQAFVAGRRNGRWRPAIKVPGTGALNARGFAQVTSVSCASAGNCAAGGFYRDGSGHRQAFVASQRNGRWRPAIKVPGTGALNAGGFAQLASVSCASAGNCAAGGFYADGSRDWQAFVASQRDGRWATAIKVPGTATLNAGGLAQVYSVSCASAGNCAAVGTYMDRGGNTRGFVVSRS